MSTLTQGQHGLPPRRHAALEALAGLIVDLIASDSKVQVAFICTHNSRRSQAAHVTFALAKTYYSLGDKIAVASAGTEVTACNERMVAALTRLGLDISRLDTTSNPRYRVGLSGDEKILLCSKRYDVLPSTDQTLVAVMVCDDAAEHCPIIPGISHRYVLTYRDPKWSDDTPQEIDAYDQCVALIGGEMFMLAEMISRHI